jgi:membrane-bound lytic murein transglycosylase B
MLCTRRLLQISLLATLLSGCTTPPSGTGQTAATGQPSVTNTTSNANASNANIGGRPAGSASGVANTPAGTSGRFDPVSRPQTESARRATMQLFGIELAAQRQLAELKVLQLLDEARYDPTVARIVAPVAPGQARAPRSWATYRGRVVEPIRIAQGQAFMQQYAAELDRASARYGVPQNIIAAIIGVETLYGKSQGTFRVLDSLATLGFDYPDASRPDRAEMFRGQLADLIELDLTGRLDARTLKGSFAGAVGIPQFMPGSIKRFAVSARGAQEINLSSNMADAVNSVANFLVEHGWQRGLPIFVPVRLPASADKLVDGGLKPTLDWPQLQAAGAKLAPSAKDAPWMRAALGVIDLPEETAGTVELRTATQNFFTITLYNRSYFYAASVADLAAALATN